jgi:hypothetical protein
MQHARQGRAWFYQLASPRIAEPVSNGNVSSPTKMESGMGVDLHRRGTSRNRLLLTGQAIVPTLIILMTSVSCSRRAAEMPEPPYRIVERILPSSSRLSDEENRQLGQGWSDAKPNPQQDQHRTSSSPYVAKVHASDTSSASAPRPASRKTETPSEALGFCVMQHRRLRPSASRRPLCLTRRRQVQNGAVGDAEQSGRPPGGRRRKTSRRCRSRAAAALAIE